MMDAQDSRVRMDVYDAPPGRWRQQGSQDWAAASTLPALPALPALMHYACYARTPLRGVRVSLVNADQWLKFSRIGNEMIITKSGRSIFPKLEVRVEGLDPDVEYSVLMEMRLAAGSRFKYSGGRWVASGAADGQHAQTVYVHPDSPAKGAAWTARNVAFRRSNAESAKLTNNTQTTEPHNLVLTSMHKYRPVFHIVRAGDCATHTVDFAETEFIAVTAYQNDAIKDMKIDENPFAKGFRKTGLSRRRRQQQQQQQKLEMGIAEALRGPSPPTSPPSPLRLSALDDGGSMGSAPCSPSSSLSATPPPSLPAGPTAGRPGRPAYLSIATILDPNFGRRRVPPCHDEDAAPTAPRSPGAQPLLGAVAPAAPYAFPGYADPFYAWPAFPYAPLPLPVDPMGAHSSCFYPGADAVSAEDLFRRTLPAPEEVPKDLTTSRREGCC